MTFFYSRRRFLTVFLLAVISLAATPQIQTYEQLLHAIREVRTVTQKRIEQAVDQEKVREAWETGKLIDEHILLHQKRADYGKQVLERLSKDLAVSQTELSFMLQFARAYPIYSPANKLSWSHYREILSIDNEQTRKDIVEEAVKKKWSRDNLRREIKRRKLSRAEDLPLKLVEVKPGKIGTYRVVKLNGQLKIDLGFETYYELPAQNGKSFKEEDIVHLSRESGNFIFSLSQETKADDLCTYNAQVIQSVDGDTFYALIDLGLGITVHERMRLRQLDAPEILSSDGNQAQKVLEKILMRSKGAIMIKIEKSADQHGRYIADVWVKNHEINPELLKTGLFTIREDES